jgi:hypothetical protein
MKFISFSKSKVIRVVVNNIIQGFMEYFRLSDNQKAELSIKTPCFLCYEVACQTVRRIYSSSETRIAGGGGKLMSFIWMDVTSSKQLQLHRGRSDRMVIV